MRDSVRERVDNWLNNLHTELNGLRRMQRRCLKHNALESAALYAGWISEKEKALDVEENIYDLVMANQ